MIPKEVAIRCRNRNGYCYVIVPKAACTAIARAAFGKEIAFHLCDSNIRNDFTFTFIRHPFDRVVSTFAMYRQVLPHKGYPKDLDEFIDLVVKNQRWDNERDLWPHVMPMVKLLPENLDFIGRFERLQEDWAVLQKKFEFPDLPPKKDQIHVTEYDIELTEKQKKALRPIYSEDFERFGY